jgi:hypothetical protein
VRLVLRSPASWGTEPLEGGRVRVSAAPSVSLDIDPLVPRPDDLEAWVRQLLVRDVPPAWVVDAHDKQERTTEVGWPMALYFLRLRHEQVVEEIRVCAIYRLLAHAGAVIVRAAPAAWPGSEAEVLASLYSARPEWGSPEAVCVADLLSLGGDA